jgi:hypothetical protein
MIKIFEEFNLHEDSIEFGDIVEFLGLDRHHHRGRKAIVLELRYDKYRDVFNFRIEFADGTQKLCGDVLLRKVTKKTYDSIRFENEMKKKSSYKHYKKEEEKNPGEYLTYKERMLENERIKEREREKVRVQMREIAKKKEEMRLKMADIDPYGEENWGEDDDLPLRRLAMMNRVPWDDMWNR